MSTTMSAGCPGCSPASCVSLKLASTQKLLSTISAAIGALAITFEPATSEKLVTQPSAGATIRVCSRSSFACAISACACSTSGLALTPPCAASCAAQLAPRAAATPAASVRALARASSSACCDRNFCATSSCERFSCELALSSDACARTSSACAAPTSALSWRAVCRASASLACGLFQRDLERPPDRCRTAGRPCARSWLSCTLTCVDLSRHQRRDLADVGVDVGVVGVARPERFAIPRVAARSRGDQHDRRQRLPHPLAAIAASLQSAPGADAAATAAPSSARLRRAECRATAPCAGGRQRARSPPTAPRPWASGARVLTRRSCAPRRSTSCSRSRRSIRRTMLGPSSPSWSASSVWLGPSSLRTNASTIQVARDSPSGRSRRSSAVRQSCAVMCSSRAKSSVLIGGELHLLR